MSGFVLLLEMIGDFRMVYFDITDQSSQKPAGLKLLSRKGRNEPVDSVQDRWSIRWICDLFRVLLFEAVVLLPEVLGKYGHGSGRYMEGAERAPESLKSRDDLGILSVSATLKITKRNDFDQIKESNRFWSPRFI